MHRMVNIFAASGRQALRACRRSALRSAANSDRAFGPRRCAIFFLGACLAGSLPMGVALAHGAKAQMPGMQMSAPPDIVSSLHRYQVPAITLVNQFGHKVRLHRVLNRKDPVLVEFFFTTCTTICGVRSAQLVAAQPKLAQAKMKVGFYTISIDPEHDTPAVMLAYSKSFGAPPPPNWQLLTGTSEQITRVEAAFNASNPSNDKMMHKALTFIRGGAGKPWVRIDGLMTTEQLVQQIQTAVAAR
ncbi:MAG: SCO family protein [Gammaproteobacteria bacterium]|nr:SCO family protein [Gammaproteobacteria bacterium]